MLTPYCLFHLLGNWSFCIFSSTLFSIVRCNRIYCHCILAWNWFIINIFKLNMIWQKVLNLPEVQNTSSWCHSSFLTWIVRDEPSMKIFLEHKICFIRAEYKSLFWGVWLFTYIHMWWRNWVTLVGYEWVPEREGWSNPRCKNGQEWELPSPRCLRGWWEEISCLRSKKIYYTEK